MTWKRRDGWDYSKYQYFVGFEARVLLTVFAIRVRMYVAWNCRGCFRLKNIFLHPPWSAVRNRGPHSSSSRDFLARFYEYSRTFVLRTHIICPCSNYDGSAVKELQSPFLPLVFHVIVYVLVFACRFSLLPNRNGSGPGSHRRLFSLPPPPYCGSCLATFSRTRLRSFSPSRTRVGLLHLLTLRYLRRGDKSIVFSY